MEVRRLLLAAKALEKDSNATDVVSLVISRRTAEPKWWAKSTKTLRAVLDAVAHHALPLCPLSKTLSQDRKLRNALGVKP